MDSDMEHVSGLLADLRDDIQHITDLAAQPQVDTKQIRQAVNDAMSSTAAQSIIANAVSRGVGSMIGSAVVNSIFAAIKAPFEVGSDVAHTAADVTAAADSVASAADHFQSMTDSVKDNLITVKDELLNAVANASQLATHQHATDQQANRQLTSAMASSMPLPNLGTVHEAVLGTKARKQPALPNSITIKLGDNSVHLVGVSDTLAAARALPNQQANPDLWDQSVQLTHQWADLFSTTTNHDWVLQSSNTWYAADGTPARTVATKSTVVKFITRINEADKIALPKVKCNIAINCGSASETALTDFMTGGAINDRAVQNTINGALHPKQITVLRDIAYILGEPAYFWDNTYVYMKLFFHALLSDTYTWSGVPATPAAWAADIQYINLDSEVLGYTELAEVINSGRHVFVEGFDWMRNGTMAVQLLYLLSSASHRIAPSHEDTHCHPASYYNWNAVPVTVLLHGEAPPAPNAALIPSNIVMQFACSMAAHRNEQDQLQRGLYAAAELFGTTSRSNDRTKASHLIDAFYGLADRTMPMPRETNFLLRILNIRPQVPPNAQSSDMAAFLSRTPTERVVTLAILAAANMSMATTLLASNNTTLMQQLGYSDPAPPAIDHTQAMLMQAWCQPIAVQAAAGPLFDAIFRVQIRKLVNLHYSFRVYTSPYMWTSAFFTQASTATAVLHETYYGMDMNTPARTLSMFSLTALVDEYPLEWGCSKYGAYIDIRKEVVRIGPPANRGWQAYRGDARYQQFATGSTPFSSLMYGWHVLQCLVNRHQQPDVPTIKYDHHVWTPGLVPDAWQHFDTPPEGAAPPVWAVNEQCWEPCTFLSYSWSAETLFAPRLDMLSTWWVQYSNSDGLMPICGFKCNSMEPGLVMAPNLGIMDFALGLGGMSMFLPQSATHVPPGATEHPSNAITTVPAPTPTSAPRSASEAVGPGQTTSQPSTLND